MHLRKALLEAGDQVEKVLKRQIGMQSADNMELGNRFAIARGCSLESFFEGHSVCAGRIFFPAERTQSAGGYANIRRINVAIDVEVRLVAMHALAHRVLQPANCEDVRGTIKRKRVFGGEPLASQNFLLDNV